MNITDFEVPTPPANWKLALAEIFGRQRELMEKYKEIEQLPAWPISLHTAAGQRVIKDFAWRTVEELTESCEAWQKHGHDEIAAKEHALEELADSFHFFVEMLVFAGISVEQCLELGNFENVLHEEAGALSSIYWRPTYAIGLAMNFLRNKAWKTSQVATDEKRFREALLQAYFQMTYIWAELGYTWRDLYTYYFRKSEVNKFRQRSQY
jgi:hypothetical protein